MYKLLNIYVIYRFNIQNLNKQCRLYQQGLTPLIKTVPGRGSWERLRERPEYEVCDIQKFYIDLFVFDSTVVYLLVLWCTSDDNNIRFL